MKRQLHQVEPREIGIGGVGIGAQPLGEIGAVERGGRERISDVVAGVGKQLDGLLAGVWADDGGMGESLRGAMRVCVRHGAF